MQISFLDYGGIITKISVPDQYETIENVVLGYKDLMDYEFNPNYFGALVGRVAGRIQNAAFILSNKHFQIEENENGHHLHGGSKGAHQVIWKTVPFRTNSAIGVKLHHTFKEEDDLYPGNVPVTITYTLTDKNQFFIDYEATTDKPTILTITNHSYFNLSGNLKNTIHNHRVTINSSKFTELDSSMLPTGRLVDVTKTPFDFRDGKAIGDGITSNHEQIKLAGNGFDHFFVFDNPNGEITIEEPNSRRTLSINTNQPGMVMYTANGLDKGLELNHRLSDKYMGICFETQASPASLQHSSLPSIILLPNQVYKKQTQFTFK